MAENAAQSIKELQERLVSADKTLGEMIQRLGKYESWMSAIFSGIAQDAKVSIDEITDYLTKKMRRENLKQSESLMKDILGIEDAKKEVEKVPTMFERVINEINAKAANKRGFWANELFHSEFAVEQAKKNFARVFREFAEAKNAPIAMAQASFAPELERLSSIDQSILSKSDLKKLQERIAQVKSDLASISKLQVGGDAYKDPSLLAALKKYQDALEQLSKVKEHLAALDGKDGNRYAANASMVEGVTRKYNENEQALAKLQQRWEELNVKKQAGLISQKDFDAQTQKILDEYDRLIAKRKEFEIGDLGQMSYQRKSEREQEEERLAQLRKSNTQARLDDEMRAEKMIKQARAERAKKEAEADANMKKAVSQQVTSYKQLSALLKQYNSLKQVKGRTQEEEAALERTRQKIKEIIAEMRKLDSEQKGSLVKARDITEYDRILAKDKEITKEKQKQNDITKQQKANLNSLLPTLQRLASAFGVAFSVRGLAQFGKKLIETRGEFEMQFVAMKQIIGDVDAATKIWNQTMQQALQSPFKAMQLVTYTKQLAAYRIETEKLFDTTKRLADISAGLGVDMGRLILAFGQVKSANFLRASEVRQFTEAGVNIAGGLAKYFTELEGRMVGTAEVMERITKRMVLFSDVEEVFKRMTDEGGEFFNMQEVQADTVKGQIAKLHDAYDQMLNTIGQANQGVIRNFVDRLNDLVRNWQNVAYVLKWNVNWVTAFGAALFALSNKYLQGATTQTLWFSKALTGNSGVLLKEAGAVRLFGNEVGILTMKQRLGVVAMRSFQGAISAVGSVLRRFWPLIVFEGIVLLTERLTRASRELKRFREELEATTSDNVVRMKEEIRGYDTLIKKMKETTEGTMARKDVMDEISRRYGKYLDFIVSEKTTIEELAGAYDKVVSSIRNYTAEKIREEQQQKLEKGVYDEYQNLINKLSGAKVQEAPSEGYISISKEQARQIAKLIEERVKSNPKVQYEELAKVINQYLGIEGVGALYNSSITDALVTYAENYRELGEELQNIRDDIEGEMPVFATEEEYKAYKKNVEDAENAIQKQNKQYEEQVRLTKETLRDTSEQWIIDDKIAKLRLENEEEVLRIRKEYGLVSEGQYNDELARLHGVLDTYEQDYNKRLETAMISQYGIFWQTTNKEARDMYNFVVSTEQALQQGTSQRNKQLKESYKGFKESLEQYNAQYQAAVNSGASKESLDKIQADIDFATLMMKAIELAAQLRGIDLSDKKTHTRTTHENASKLISLIKEMRSEYDKLSKSAYGYAKSEEKVRDAYKDSVKEILGKAGITDYDFTTNEGMIKALEKVKSYATKLGKDAAAEVQKYIDQLETEIQINAQVRIKEDFARDIEKMFSDYELTLNFKSMGLPEDLAKGLFGVDTSSLDEISDFLQSFIVEHEEDWNEDINKIYIDALKKVSDKEQEQYKKNISDLFKRVKNSAQEMQVVMEQSSADINFAKMLFDQNMIDDEMSKIKKRIQDNIDEIAKLTPSDGSKPTGVAEQQIARLEAENKILQNRITRLTQMYGNITAEQYTDLIRSTIEWENEQRQKVTLEQLKKMPSYIEAMGRTVGWSNVKLKEMLNYLQDIISVSGGEMSLEDYKTLISQVDKIQQQIHENKAPFGLDGFANVAQMLKDTIDADEKLNELEIEKKELLNEEKRLQEESVRLQETLNNLKQSQEEETDQNKIEQYGQEIQGVMQQLEQNQKAQSVNSNMQLKNAASMQTIVKGNMKTLVLIDAIIHAANNAVQDMYHNLQKVEEILKDYSVDTEHGSFAKWSKGMETFAKASQDATNGWEAFKKGDVTGVEREVVNGIVDIWHGINEIVNQKHVDTIYNMEKEIDSLQHAYERLEKQISKTWDTASYISSYNEEMRNLQEQYDALTSMIAAEEAKKNTNEDTLQEYKDQQQDILDNLDDIKQKQLEVFGGIGEEGYRDAAQGFVDAWKSAFLETGDGLQGLQDHFDEFLQDWFVKQATMQGVAKYYQKVFDYINGVVEDGSVPTRQDIENARLLADEAALKSDELMQAYASIFGLGGEGALSGLAAGIQGMTEEQANILEAYWNSVRGYTASIDMNVSRIAQILGAGGDNSNPMLAQMTLVAQNTNNIRTLLESVRFNGGEGVGIRVYSY